jgi:hypothetical protein
MSRTLGDKKEKRTSIFNRRKPLWHKDLGVAACPADLTRYGARTYVDLIFVVLSMVPIVAPHIVLPFSIFVGLTVILGLFVVFPLYDIFDSTVINRLLSGREFGPANFATFVGEVNTDHFKISKKESERTGVIITPEP